jgi:hypothetical protein
MLTEYGVVPAQDLASADSCGLVATHDQHLAARAIDPVARSVELDERLPPRLDCKLIQRQRRPFLAADVTEPAGAGNGMHARDLPTAPLELGQRHHASLR